MLERLPEKIKELRIEKGWKQEELGERIGLSRDAISKWENGKNIPRLPELQSLATVFEMKVSELVQEAEEERNSMLESLVVKNISASKTIEYFGLEDVYKAYVTYWKDFNKYSENDPHWIDNNTFLTLINRKTKEINGIRDFGMYSPTPADYLFVSNFLPVSMYGGMEKEQYKNISESVLENFEKELDDAVQIAKNSNKQPLFLYDYCGTNNYIAWSFDEKKPVCVYGYKAYRKYFSVSELYCVDEKQISENHNYMVIVPTDKLIDDVGLILSSDGWNIRMTWDIWEKRELKNVMITDWSFCPEHEKYYKDAIKLINMTRKRDCGCVEQYIRLEKRVAAYERLYEKGAPIVILQSEMSLLVKAMGLLQEELLKKALKV